MPQLDFFNILSQIEYGVVFFLFFYFFNLFFVIPTLLTIFQVRTMFFSFPAQLFNSFSFLTFTFYNYSKDELKDFATLIIQASETFHSTFSFNKILFDKLN